MASHAAYYIMNASIQYFIIYKIHFKSCNLS